MRAKVFFDPSLIIKLIVVLVFLIFPAAFILSPVATQVKKWRHNNNDIFFNTPEEACKDFIKVEFPGNNYQTRIQSTNNPEYKRCEYKDGGTWYDKGIVYLENAPNQPAPSPTPSPSPTQDPMAICNQTPNGKWSYLANESKVSPQPGKDFSQPQKDLIRDEWQKESAARNNGNLLSEDPYDPCNKPRMIDGKRVVGLTLPPKGRQIPGQFKAVDPCQAQVDHIIPARINNQNCGSNSFSNARVISQCANNKKKNNPNFDLSKISFEDCQKKN